MKYSLPGAGTFWHDIAQHIPDLEKVLSALADQGYLTTLKEYAVDDRFTEKFRMMWCIRHW